MQINCFFQPKKNKIYTRMNSDFPICIHETTKKGQEEST